MIKKYKKLTFIPVASSFSDFKNEDGSQQDFASNEHEDSLYDELNENMFVITVLKRLNDKHKVVFMLMLMKELGYNLNHEDCAGIMSISRQTYIKLVKSVRLKVDRLLVGSYNDTQSEI